MNPMENNAKYLAGVFDVRGFIGLRPETYHYYIFFNFTEKELKLWEKIKKDIENFAWVKIYRLRRGNEYQLYIGRKNNIRKFLQTILPFSKRKEEIITFLKILERGYKTK